MSEKIKDRLFFPCFCIGTKIIDPQQILQDGCWYEWLDKFGNIEIARIKFDFGFNHFYPSTEIIKEENVIGFRFIKENKKRYKQKYIEPDDDFKQRLNEQVDKIQNMRIEILGVDNAK